LKKRCKLEIAEMKKILIFNASPEGSKGNSHQLIKKNILPLLAKKVEIEVVHLVKLKKPSANKKLLKNLNFFQRD
jgi:hypothetical protein